MDPYFSLICTYNEIFGLLLLVQIYKVCEIYKIYQQLMGNPKMFLEMFHKLQKVGIQKIFF